MCGVVWCSFWCGVFDVMCLYKCVQAVVYATADVQKFCKEDVKQYALFVLCKIYDEWRLQEVCNVWYVK